MKIFEVVIAVVVIASLVYVSFILTLGDWFAALRKGQAVTLLPERRGRNWPLWTQAAMVLLGLVLAAALIYFLWIPIVRLPAAPRLILDIAGLVIYLGGCAFMLWARGTLGRNWGISTSRNVKLLDDHQLVQDGPYAFVRNPMYSGWWAAMLGLLLLYPTWVVLAFLAFSVFAFIGRARREETVLAERFGQAYAEYKKRTKFLIPFIY